MQNLKVLLINGGFKKLKQNKDGSFNAIYEGAQYKNIKIVEGNIIHDGMKLTKYEPDTKFKPKKKEISDEYDFIDIGKPDEKVFKKVLEQDKTGFEII